MKLHRALVPLVLTACVSAAAVADMPAPGPELPPARVVELQLNALQHNDEPGPNAGIARVWQFAHPANRESTGPLSRFSAMMQSPPYRILIDHRSHTVEPIRVGERRAAFEVTVTAKSGRVVGYLWQLEKLLEGPMAGTWMTISVSPPIPRGEAL